MTLTAVDLFAGAGGLSYGLTVAGFRVAVAVEADQYAASTFQRNHRSTNVLCRDIRMVSGPEILGLARLQVGELSLLTGCPPCQGFSSLATKRRSANLDEVQNSLLFELLRLARSVRPKAILLENVPNLARDGRFAVFCTALSKAGYIFDHAILNAADFGVPQRRKRLVLIAFRGKSVPSGWATPTGRYKTVRDAIGEMPPAGCSRDELHDYPESRSNRIKMRIAATPKDGGTRHDVPKAFRCSCHEHTNGYNDVYGRMAWDQIAPTITSGCTNPSKGRFLHPQEDRAITLREAALLQSFPRSYQFDLSRGKEHVALQIGNAFPPRLIIPIARRVKDVILS